MPFFRRSRLVERRADGGFDVRLGDDEREVLAGLLGQLADQLDDPTDPSMHRLAPPAYADDPERDAAYQLLAGDELREKRREAIATVVATASKPRITEDEAWAWLRALNALRLVVGTQLDIDDDTHDWDPAQATTELEAARWAVYGFASVVQQELVVALGS